jgi:hypothetical protein
VRRGFENTAGELERRGIPIPHPPLISPNPATGAQVQVNEKASFIEGINRAGQLESTCDTCADVTDGSPVVGKGELDPFFPQFHTNSNGLGARHNADQCLLCHAQPTLGGSGGFSFPIRARARLCVRKIPCSGCSASFWQTKHRPELRRTVRPHSGSSVQVQAGRNPRRQRAPALGGPGTQIVRSDSQISRPSRRAGTCRSGFPGRF